MTGRLQMTLSFLLLLGLSGVLTLFPRMSTLLDTPTTAAQVPQPTPFISPPDSEDICGPVQYSGGDSIVIRTLEISLPEEGEFTATSGIADPGGEFVRVCHVQGNSAIFLDLSGIELSRVVNDPSSAPVLDEIAESVRLVESSPSPTPGTGGETGIQPPRTGTGGLIRDQG